MPHFGEEFAFGDHRLAGAQGDQRPSVDAAALAVNETAGRAGQDAWARTEALPATTGVVSAPGSVTVTSSPPPSSATALTDPP
jgi:hypothetical protein